MDLHFKTYGQGPALVILHGLFGSLDNWATHARRLAEDYSVYLYDARNHGRSPHFPEHNYEVMAEDLLRFLDHHGIYQTHLLGHSMGGKTVMTFAGMYPERIDKLIVADMGIREYPPHHGLILDVIRKVNPREFETRQEVDRVLHEGGVKQTAIRQFLLKSLGRDEYKRLTWKFNFPVIDDQYHRILQQVGLDHPFEQPTLFLYGAESEYVHERDFPEILEHFPEARFHRLEKAGHWLHAEQPDEFLRVTQTFLRDA